MSTVEMGGRYEPGDPRTKGLVHKTKSQALDLMNSIVENWEPRHQTFYLRNSPYMVSLAACLPAAFFTFRFRKLLGLAKYKDFRYLTMGPALFMSSSFTTIMHYQVIRSDILIKETPCSVCVDIRSSLCQLIGGAVFPSLMAYVGSLATGLHLNLRTIPNNWRGWIPLTRGVMTHAAPFLLVNVVIQLGISAVVVRKQYEEVDQMMAMMLTRFEEKERKQSEGTSS